MHVIMTGLVLVFLSTLFGAFCDKCYKSAKCCNGCSGPSNLHPTLDMRSHIS